MEKGYGHDEIVTKMKKFGGAGVAKLIKSLESGQAGVE